MLRFPLLALATLALAACSGNTEIDDEASGSGTTGSGSGSGGAGASGGASASGTTGSGGQDFTNCGGPGECIVATPGCCGTCGAPELSTVTAVAADLADLYFESTCPDPENTPCPGCASYPNGNLYAYCDAGHCRAADLRQEELSECTQAIDCTLRYGSGCCEACSGTWEPGLGGDLVAVNASKLGELTALVCPPEDIGCPACAPIYPPGTVADCIEGRCIVTVLEGAR